MERDDFNKALGKRIKTIRKINGLTLLELGKAVGISESTAQRYEDGKIKSVSIDMVRKFSQALNTPLQALMGWDKDTNIESPTKTCRGVRIPVLGRVVAGIPIEAIEEILDYEEITPEMAATGDFFALQVRGDSMLPTLKDGDVVIVKKQPTVDSGDIAIVLVNGNDATVKEIKESAVGITLIGHNVAVYTPHFYSNEEIKNLPVQVLGKVVEMRRKF